MNNIATVSGCPYTMCPYSTLQIPLWVPAVLYAGVQAALGMVPVDLRRVLGKREPHAVGHPSTGQELNGLLRSSGPVDAHQDPPPGSGAEPGLVQCPADDLDVVGGGVRTGVSGPQHERRALTPTIGAVVEPCGQGVVAKPLLEDRGRTLFLLSGH